jgi:hypothetical protein
MILMKNVIQSFSCPRQISTRKNDKTFIILGQSGDEDVKILKEIIDELGGWPMLQGSAWDDSKWSFEEIITKIRKTLGHRTDEVFNIASFIINLENANNVSLP